MTKKHAAPNTPDPIVINVVYALPGGCDGRDPTSRGGPVRAFATLTEARHYVGKDSRYEIRSEYLNPSKTRLSITTKLTAQERLYLEMNGSLKL